MFRCILKPEIAVRDFVIGSEALNPFLDLGEAVRVRTAGRDYFDAERQRLSNSQSNCVFDSSLKNVS